MVEIGFDIEHHDHAYVERQGGSEMLLHLRDGRSRASYRANAIERAHQCFVGAEASGAADAEVGGLGLIVLQRSVLALEDIAGLIHAVLDHPDEQFLALRSTIIPDLNRAMTLAHREPQRVIRDVFRLVSEDELTRIREEDPEATDVEIAAARSLRVLEEHRWTLMLERAASMWLQMNDPAKATMHGFAFVAGSQIENEACGSIADDFLVPERRFALGLLGELDREHAHIETRRSIVLLDHDTVGAYARHGKSSAGLYGEMCEARASAIDQGYRGVMRDVLARRLDSRERDAFAALAARQARRADEAASQAARGASGEEAHDD